MQINWRKWNRILHRDLGYFFFGMSVIYALSGIALNHISDWNPSYIVTRKNVQWQRAFSEDAVPKEAVLKFLEQHGERDNYKKHYRPAPRRLKIFLKSGSVELDLTTGRGVIEKLKRRSLFYEVNFLHYNPKKMWTWFSDAFCIALMIISVTGLFIIKGKKGITGRGAWLTGLGVAIPLALLMLYL